jgi:hypothetical protein
MALQADFQGMNALEYARLTENNEIINIISKIVDGME